MWINPQSQLQFCYQKRNPTNQTNFYDEEMHKLINIKPTETTTWVPPFSDYSINRLVIAY